jgi:cadmium resistance protein CadD (predicted permease)
VHCIRAYQQFCVMVNMTVMTADRLDRLEHYIETYEKYCTVSLILVPLSLWLMR